MKNFKSFLILLLLSCIIMAVSKPVDKVTCTYPTLPACLLPAQSGSSFCSNHTGMPVIPGPGKCTYFIARPTYRCYNDAVQGSDLCQQHYLPPLK